VWISPTNSVLGNAAAGQRKSLKALKLRVILLKSPDGKVSVLITNLLNTVTFPCAEIIALYFDRWEVEEYYLNFAILLFPCFLVSAETHIFKKWQYCSSKHSIHA